MIQQFHRYGVAVTITDEPLDLEVTHLCPRCGSTSHGQPLVENGFVSISRSSGFTAVAYSAAAPIGIDIESVARVGRHPVAAALLHPTEAAELGALSAETRDRRLAALWTAKEAILKSTGRGLNVDPGLLALRDSGDEIELVDWPAAAGLVERSRIHFFGVNGDVVGSLAIAVAE